MSSDTIPEAPSTLEAPSGKTAGTENFPVGSQLIAARLRPHVMAFYDLARAGDDIADDPTLTPADKLARLEALEAALTGRGEPHPGAGKAVRLRDSLAATGVPVVHAVELLAAFKQDAEKQRYADWEELMAYCRLSAAPVGRFLLDLHGEDRRAWPASDALCAALQVINHLQDAQEDFNVMDRVYLPGDWMAAAGASVSDLARPTVTAGVRQVLDRCLDSTAKLVGEARRLPAGLRTRLAYESAVIVRIAEVLVARLRTADPLARKVKLGKADVLGCLVVGLWRAAVR